MHNESQRERIEILDPPSQKKSFTEKYAGPAVFAGLFVVWPAVNLATTFVGYKTVCKQVELEELKQAAKQITQS